MAKRRVVHGRVQKDGDELNQEEVKGKSKKKVSSVTNIKSTFGRPSVTVEWEIPDTNQWLVIKLRPLRFGEKQIVREKVYGRERLENVKIDNKWNELSEWEQAKNLGYETPHEMLEDTRRQQIETILMALEEPAELKEDRDWWFEEATDDFILVLYSVAVNAPLKEDNTGETFPEVDPKPEE